MSPPQLAYVRLVTNVLLVLPQGRYVVGKHGDHDGPRRGSSDVLVLRTATDEGTGRSSKKLAPHTQVTYVAASDPLDADDVKPRLDRWKRESAEREAWAATAFATVNLAIRAYRTGARDPYAMELTPGDVTMTIFGCADAVTAAKGRIGVALSPYLSDGERLNAGERARMGELVGDGLAGAVPLLETDELLGIAAREANHGRVRSAAAALRAAGELITTEIDETNEVVRTVRAAALQHPGGDAERLLTAVSEAQDAVDAWRRGRPPRPE